MKITMVMVCSVNGKITRSTDPHIYKWTSREDQHHFFSLLEQASLIVMGSKTYDQIRGKVKHREGTMRVVLTRNPQKYSGDSVKGQLEFSSESPKDLVKRFGEKGHTEMLLVGGGEINSLFLQAKLVHELLITIEPLLFGQGKPLVTEGDFFSQLNLISFEKLNNQGTLLLRYEVMR